MPDTDESAYRRHYRASSDEVEVREGDELESEDGIFEVRMPIASTGEVRNVDDDPLTRDELDGMARQLETRQIGVFPSHGGDDIVAGKRYSPFERLGDWRESDIQTRDEGEDVLMATARMPDPETLPAPTGSYRQALAILKEQAMRGIGQDASIAWRTDDEFPGEVDLMEASIVGIGADWRTNTDDEAAEVVTQAALDAGADPDDLLATVRATLADADTSDTDSQDTDDMSDTEPNDEPTDEQDADDGEATEREDAPAWAADLRDLLESIHEAVREDGMDNEEEDDEEDDEEDEEQSADEPTEEQDADTEGDTDAEQDADPDDTQDSDNADNLREEVESLREELADIREGGVDPDDVDTPNPDAEQDAEDDESDAEPTRDATEDPTEGLGEFR